MTNAEYSHADPLEVKTGGYYAKRLELDLKLSWKQDSVVCCTDSLFIVLSSCKVWPITG